MSDRHEPGTLIGIIRNPHLITENSESWRRIVDGLKGRRERQEEDLDRELRTHLDLEAEEQQEAGKSAAAPQESGIHHCSHSDAGLRHWREYSDLYARPCRNDEIFTRAEPQPTLQPGRHQALL